ncbi:hypothetical protein SAMN05444920_12144 [Nonomuraea solani]|uniref:Uncharacterized protein n=1 Tax=Nonomuraea solani TaxID=1144553 RepID=A0A1H6EX74_9ACTN|nr:hypothetical protein [Nonomuraea solani]SEH01596.1 hypothetical protein SAMN05444920_12144 [Nonomuraea solani]
MSEFDPASYRAAGIQADEARRWWRWRLSAAQARDWRAAGIADPALATQWATAGVTPETVTDCRAAGLTAAEMLLWHEYEFGPADAIAGKRRGHTPEEAFDLVRGRKPRRSEDPDAFSSLMAFNGDPRDQTQRFVAAVAGADALVLYGYINENWTDAEAAAWAGQNIDAATAHMWQELGLRPGEARRYILRGLTPMAVARAWWQAGIPFEEMASWAGAGLSPQEAADQRAKGVTAEQAETLRALRDG